MGEGGKDGGEREVRGERGGKGGRNLDRASEKGGRDLKGNYDIKEETEPAKELEGALERVEDY